MTDDPIKVLEDFAAPDGGYVEGCVAFQVVAGATRARLLIVPADLVRSLLTYIRALEIAAAPYEAGYPQVETARAALVRALGGDDVEV